MTWTAAPVDESLVTAEYLYDLSKRHRLVPENVVDALSYYERVARGCRVIIIKEGPEKVGELLITDIVPGESAVVDFVPKPKYFAAGEPFAEEVERVMTPIMKRLIEHHKLARLTAMVPKSRSRTCKALTACGFKKEGVMRRAIKLQRQDRQDLVIMGMLSEKEF